MQLEGVDLASSALPEFLAGRVGGPAARVSVPIDTGPLYRLAGVGLDGDVPSAASAALDLRLGEPAAAHREQSARGR